MYLIYFVYIEDGGGGGRGEGAYFVFRRKM